MNYLQSVLVVGGGSAGLTCAAFLRKLGVATVDLSELNQDYDRGAALGLSSNALLPLREIGALEGVLAYSIPNLHFHVCDSTGKTVVDLDRPQPREMDFPVNVVLTRRALSRVLTQVAQDAGVRLIYGVQLEQLTPDGEGVTARFANGDVRRYDAVIGADGIGSTVRRLIWGEAPIATVNEAGWRWLTPTRPSFKRSAFYVGTGSTRLGLFPLPGGVTYAVMSEAEDGTLASPLERRRQDVLERISSQFSGAFAQDVVADLPTDVSNIHFGRFPALLMPKPWNKGRILLIGDAAHAMPPHSSSGAAMAIEDSGVLAQALAQSGSWDEAMLRFMDRRWPRVEQVFRMACARVRTKAQPGDVGQGAHDPATLEKVTTLWKFLLQPA